jgi:hypothetical protein
MSIKLARDPGQLFFALTAYAVRLLKAHKRKY